LHLVIGAGEFLGDRVSKALASEAPVIELNADADDETLADAMRTVEVVHNCATAWSPGRRLRYRRDPPRLLRRVVDAARKAGIRRIVQVSTADVYGPDHAVRISERSKLAPVHAYERLKLFEEGWLLGAAQDLEVVVLRPARVFGLGEDWMLPRLMRSLARGRVWLPGGGRVMQTFIAAEDVGRACLAAADRGATCWSLARGRPGSDPRSSTCLTTSPTCKRSRSRRRRRVARLSGPASTRWT
jgi:nucleoside-diphosphate-sugar epimerase